MHLLALMLLFVRFSSTISFKWCTKGSARTISRVDYIHQLQYRAFSSETKTPTSKLFANKRKNKEDNIKAGLKTEFKLEEGEQKYTGLVIERVGDRLVVQPLNATDSHATADEIQPPNNISTILCMQRAHLSNIVIVAGDVVEYTSTDEHGVVFNLLPRKNLLERPAAATGELRKRNVFKAIGSNIDQIVIVIAAQPYVPLHTADRYLLIAKAARIPKVSIVVNKIDLPESEAFIKSVQDYYRALPITILSASTNTSTGLDQLLHILKDQTSILVGQSGVGKSSLINAIIPEVSIRVAPLSKDQLYGSHTTSNAKLYHLPAGGRLIDSPGVREMAVWHFDADQIEAGYEEIAKESVECKYNDCNHIDPLEKDCAVKRAVREGRINIDRYNSYIDLITRL